MTSSPKLLQILKIYGGEYQSANFSFMAYSSNEFKEWEKILTHSAQDWLSKLLSQKKVKKLFAVMQ